MQRLFEKQKRSCKRPRSDINETLPSDFGNTEIIQPGDYFFVRVERKDENETRYKLAPITEGPFPVLRVDSTAKTVVIKIPDESVEKDSRSPVTIDPKPDNTSYKEKETLPSPISSIISNYQADEKTTLENVTVNLPRSQDDEEKNPANHSKTYF